MLFEVWNAQILFLAEGDVIWSLKGGDSIFSHFNANVRRTRTIYITFEEGQLTIISAKFGQIPLSR